MKRLTVFGLLAVGTTSALAQTSIKPRPLGAITTTAKEVLGNATLARQLSNGSVIVNDPIKRRLMLLDPSLQTMTIIADSTAGAANSYGARPGALIPYLADSTLYLDATAGSFLVIDPVGKVARVMSPPRPSDNNFLSIASYGYPGFDAKGRMVYRTQYPRQMMQMPDGSVQPGSAPDTAPVIRVSLDTRKADTVGAIKLARTMTTTMAGPTGGTMTMMMPAPLPTVDDWAVLSDGTIALVRGQDYHIDWIRPDGSKSSSAKIAFDWKRLTDDMKTALIDSMTKARSSSSQSMSGGGPMQIMSMGGGSSGGSPNMSFSQTIVNGPPPAAASAPPATSTTTTTTDKAKAPAGTPAQQGASSAPPGATGGSGASNPAASASGAASPDKAMSEKLATIGGANGAPFAMPTIPGPVVTDLPDYMPAFQSGSARPDADANLWLRTSTQGSAAGTIVYDVVSSKGELVDRVEVPRGITIVGFGKGGVVYVVRRDPDGMRFGKAMVH